MLLVGMAGLVVAMLLTGTRPASLEELSSRVAAGDVTRVEVLGGMSPTAQGSSLAEIRWHDGLLPRYTEVRQVSSGSDDVSTQSVDNRGVAVVGMNLVETLTAQTPDGELDIATGQYPSGTRAYLFDWNVPVWVTATAMVSGLAVLVMLITGQEPRLATRWAWFWVFVLLGLAGVLAYLLVGVRRSGQPGEGSRLTGGWAFVIMLVIQATWPWWTHG